MNLPLLTLGVTLLGCVLAVLGVRSWSAGQAQHQALVDRMSQTGPLAVGRGRPPPRAGGGRRRRRHPHPPAPAPQPTPPPRP
ncbi:hypothetical protein ACWGI0_34755, partial [Streptomyces sp. NPDC054802]